MEEITPADSVVPVYLVPLTVEEIAEREAYVAEQESAERARTAAKEAALAKLAKLGLTEEEITALIGA